MLGDVIRLTLPFLAVLINNTYIYSTSKRACQAPYDNNYYLIIINTLQRATQEQLSYNK